MRPRIVAESLVRAEMRGTDTHGLPYLKLLVERVEARMVSLPTRVTVLNDDGATALLDGGNGIGQIAGWQAMETEPSQGPGARDRPHARPEYQQPRVLRVLYDACCGAGVRRHHDGQRERRHIAMGRRRGLLRHQPHLHRGPRQWGAGRAGHVVERGGPRQDAQGAAAGREDPAGMGAGRVRRCRPTIPAPRSRERCFLSEGRKGTA